MYKVVAHRAPAVAVVAAMIAALSVAGAGSASATSGSTAGTDGVHLLPDVWTEGCQIDFSLDATASSEYRANVLNGLTAISSVTGMTFNQVGAGDSRAAIRYSVIASLPDGEAGLASNYGDITLLDVSALPSANSAQLDGYVRDRIIAHETLHVLGLDHDDDAWTNNPDEVMNPSLTAQPLEFGAGDVAGMERLRGLNRCSRPSPTAPAPVPTVDPTIAAQVQAETGESQPVAVATSTAKQPSKTPKPPKREDSQTPPVVAPPSPSPPAATPPKRGESQPPKRGETPAPTRPAAPVVAPPKPAAPVVAAPVVAAPKPAAPVATSPSAPVVTPPKREESQPPKREESQPPKREESQPAKHEESPSPRRESPAGISSMSIPAPAGGEHD
jgi:hypothetical protein